MNDRKDAVLRGRPAGPDLQQADGDSFTYHYARYEGGQHWFSAEHDGDEVGHAHVIEQRGPAARTPRSGGCGRTRSTGAGALAPGSWITSPSTSEVTSCASSRTRPARTATRAKTACASTTAAEASAITSSGTAIPSSCMTT